MAKKTVKEMLAEFRRSVKALRLSGDLNALATLFCTDKWNNHWYTKHYMRYFSERKNEKLKLLEIGVGAGDSLRMWKQYFPRAMVFGIDILDKRSEEEKRIRTFQGNQNDQKFLEKVIAETGALDIIIDDGGHINSDVIQSFNVLFPLLSAGGIYAIEDTQTSRIEEFGGDSRNPENPKTTIGYFSRLSAKAKEKSGKKSALQKSVSKTLFFKDIIFVFKKKKLLANSRNLSRFFILAVYYYM